MAFLIDRYFEGLPQEIKDRPETNTVYHILIKRKGFDYKEFVAGISNIEKGHLSFQKPEQNATVNNISDFRIRKYMIKHFRKFDEKSGKPFMLDFVDENEEVNSLFLVGKNGSGKTSLYNGLEYMYTNAHISTIRQRAINNRESFLPYGKRKMDEIGVSIEINSLEGEVYKVLSSPLQTELNFEPFFCSEYDLQEIQQNINLKEFFSVNLGLSEMSSILLQMRESIDNLKTKENLSVSVIDKIPNADALQSDIFLLMSEKKRSDEYRTRLERFNSIAIATEEFQNIEAEKDVLGKMNEIKRRIENVVDSALKYTSELNSFKFFLEKQPVIEKYKQVLSLLNASSLMDAYELYITLPPIEDFGKELYNYSSYISQRFFDRKSRHAKQINMQDALNFIEELIKSETESERQRILNKDKSSTIIPSHYIDSLEKLYNALLQNYQKDEKAMLDVCEKTIATLLNRFTHLGDIPAEGNEQIKIIATESEIRSVITNEKIFGHNGTTSPELFYNSFRYKLYCISVKVALAFMSMELFGFNAPLIFDDVFTASDFDNSIHIDDFFEIVFNTYEDLGIGKQKDLQIILFTHDEVVLNCISQSMEMQNYPNGIKYICGILQETASLEDDDIKKAPNGLAYLLYDKIS